MYILQRLQIIKILEDFFELFSLIRLNGINEALTLQFYINVPEYPQITHAPPGPAIGLMSLPALF
jgi:hypothetical protein